MTTEVAIVYIYTYLLVGSVVTGIVQTILFFREWKMQEPFGVIVSVALWWVWILVATFMLPYKVSRDLSHLIGWFIRQHSAK